MSCISPSSQSSRPRGTRSHPGPAPQRRLLRRPAATARGGPARRLSRRRKTPPCPPSSCACSCRHSRLPRLPPVLSLRSPGLALLPLPRNPLLPPDLSRGRWRPPARPVSPPRASLDREDLGLDLAVAAAAGEFRTSRPPPLPSPSRDAPTRAAAAAAPWREGMLWPHPRQKHPPSETRVATRHNQSASSHRGSRSEWPTLAGGTLGQSLYYPPRPAFPPDEAQPPPPPPRLVPSREPRRLRSAFVGAPVFFLEPEMLAFQPPPRLPSRDAWVGA